MQRSHKMRISVSFFGIVITASLFFTHAYLSLAAILAAALHELSHILAARVLGVKLSYLRLDIFGAAIGISGEISSYKKEAAVALAGPLANLILFCLSLPFLDENNGFLSLFASASLFLGLLNLLPVKELDGGRVLFSALASVLSLRAAQRAVGVTSFLFIFALWSLSVYLLLRLGASLSLFIFCSSIFCKTFVNSPDALGENTKG